MSVAIRLQRTGKRNQPSYRVGVFDSRTRRQGRAIEFIGLYDPRNKDDKQQYSINGERAIYWLSVGAQPSTTVASLFKKCGVSYESGSTRVARHRAKSNENRKAMAAAGKLDAKHAKKAERRKKQKESLESKAKLEAAKAEAATKAEAAAKAEADAKAKAAAKAEADKKAEAANADKPAE